MSHRRAIAAALVLLAAAAPARGDISFIINADQLTTSGNIVIPDGTTVFLVAATSGNAFAIPTAGNYTTGSTWGNVGVTNVVLWQSGAETSLGHPGVVDETPSIDTEAFPGWTSGNVLALYWFPGVTYNSTSQSALLTTGTSFGTFNPNSTGADAPLWITPSDGSSGVVLAYLTTNGTLLGPGNDVATFGLVAIPEPAETALAAAALALGAILWRRRRTAR